MHEAVMNTGKPEDYKHYQQVCDALNSQRPEPGYGWQMVTLANHTMGHTWKMVWRSDKQPTQSTVQGLMSQMIGASLAIKHMRENGFVQLTQQESELVCSLLDDNEQELLDRDLTHWQIEDPESKEQRPMNEDDRQRFLNINSSVRGKVYR